MMITVVPRATAETYLFEMMDARAMGDLLGAFNGRWSARAFAHAGRPRDIGLDLAIGAGNPASDVDEEWLRAISSRATKLQFVNVWGERRGGDDGVSTYLGCPSKVLRLPGNFSDVQRAISESPLFYWVVAFGGVELHSGKDHIQSTSVPCYEGEGWLVIDSDRA